jgi:hypothetical protein
MSKAQKTKQSKPQRKMIYEETYKKGTFWMDDVEKLIEWLKQQGVTREIMKAGKNDDGTEYVVMKIDGFNP